MTSRKSASKRTLVKSVLDLLAERLPRGWDVRVPGRVSVDALPAEGDEVVEIRAPDGSAARLVVEAKSSVHPRDAEAVIGRLRVEGSEGPSMVVASFLSPRTREILRSANVGYLDLTGNLWLALDEPGLFLSDRGSDKAPASKQPVRTLTGVKASRIVRGLCDCRPPISLSALAKLAGSTLGYVSKILTFLEQEAYVTREHRGDVVRVDWQQLLERWRLDYEVFGSNRVLRFREPRGIEPALGRLSDPEGPMARARYAVTGSVAAARWAQVGRPGKLMMYVEQPEQVAEALELHPSRGTANLFLLEPFDAVVFDRTVPRDGLVLAALSQVVVDCLTAPDRMAADGQALLEWMSRNETAWQVAAPRAR